MTQETAIYALCMKASDLKIPDASSLVCNLEPNEVPKAESIPAVTGLLTDNIDKTLATITADMQMWFELVDDSCLLTNIPIFFCRYCNPFVNKYAFLITGFFFRLHLRIDANNF